MKRGERGFTITEMLIATTIMMAVTGSVFTLLSPSQGTFQAQPEVSDMQQRMRVAADTLTKDLIMAGAGTYTGASAGALYNYLAPIVPYRTGDQSADAPGSFYSDRISVMYVPPTPAQTTVSDPMPPQSSELKVTAQPNCPATTSNSLCGFEQGMRLLIFDTNGNWDPFTITQVQAAALHIQHRDQDLSVKYGVGSYLTQVATHTYYLKTDTTTNTFQLRHYDGYQTDLPVVDHVVKLAFEYFGEPQPPQLLPGKAMTDPTGPWTTYGPKPPALGVNNANDSWGAGENCTFKVENGVHAPRLDTLTAGVAQMKLDEAIFKTGPQCPDAAAASRYDADLLRIRRVRVNLRVQAAAASMRGPAGVLFTRGGTSSSAQRYVPDQEIRFDITPRNMNLGR
jgi:type II secretory pathway pseudopilin PulG